MAESGSLLSASDVTRVSDAVLFFEHLPRNRPVKIPLRRPAGPRPPIFAILLADLETGQQVEAALLQKVTTHEIQHVKLRGEPDGGTFTLTFDPAGDGSTIETTAAIAFDATAAVLKSALLALNAFNDSDVEVSKFSGGGLWQVEFIGQYAGIDVPLMTVNDSVSGFAEVVVVAGSQWEDTGKTETVEAVIPVGSPTPMVAGAMVAADFYHGAGYCVKAVECRDFDNQYVEIN